jgi:hypothetical protein
MPAAAIAIAGILASAGTFSALTGGVVATFLGISGALLSTTTAMIVAGVVGFAVQYGLSAALGMNKRPKVDLSGVAQDRKQLIRSAATARQVVYGRAMVSGPLAFARSTGPDLRYLHLVVPLATHELDAIEAVWINDVAIPPEQMDSAGLVTGGTYAGRVRIKKYLGTQTEADADLVAEVEGWTAAHKLLGCAYLYVRLEYTAEAFATGLSGIRAVVRGKPVYDPRTEASAYSNNWALCVLDYLRAEFGLACENDEIDWAAAIAAANVCDELVQLDAGATSFQPRYCLDGTFTLDERPIDVLARMQTAAAGELAYVQGMFRLYPGAFDTPAEILTVSDAAGPLQIVTKPPLNELFNAVKGTFISPADTWQAREFPAVTDAAAEAQDGERIWQELELPFTIDGTAAQRLARIALRRAREPITVTMPMRYAGVRLCAWQMVGLTLPDMGWVAKPFRIVRWTFDATTGQPTVVLREESADSWAWDYEDASPVTPGESTTLINPLAPPPPTALAVTPSTTIQADGAVLPSLLVTWTPSAHAFVTAVEVQWRWELAGGGSSDWRSATVPVGTARWELAPVEVGVDYEVRVRAVAGLARSAWTSPATGTGAADVTAPGLPTGVTATGITRGVALRWTNPTDRDLWKVEVWERADTSGVSAKVGESFSDFFVRSGLDPAEGGLWKLRAVDRSGNASAFTAEVAGAATLLVSDDLGNEIINASHLQTGTAVITGSAQIADLTVDRIHIKTGSISTHAFAQWAADVTVNRPPPFPSEGPIMFNYGSLGGLDVTVPDDGRVIVFVQVRSALAATPATIVETTSDGGGGSGE